MDRSKRMKQIIAFVVVRQMQFQTLMIQVLILAFMYLRNRKRARSLTLGKHDQRLYPLGKHIPLFPHLEKIFGKDRAGGSQAESGNDMNEQVHQEDEIGMFDEAPDESQSSLQQSTSMASTAKKMKRKKPCSSPRVSPDVALCKELCETIRYVIDQQGKHLEAFGRTMAAPQEKKNVGQMLINLGFDDHEIVMLVLKFSENPQLEKYFWALLDDQKVEYVRAILSS